MLPDNIGPSRLVAAREAHETAPARQVVDNRGLFGDAHRVLRAHHITHLPDPHVLRDRGPVGVEDPRIGAAFVALGPEMMLDGGDAPESQVVGCANDSQPVSVSW